MLMLLLLHQSLTGWLPIHIVFVRKHTQKDSSIKICYSIIKEFNAFNNNNLIIHPTLVRWGNVQYDVKRCITLFALDYSQYNEIGISSIYSFICWMNTDVNQNEQSTTQQRQQQHPVHAFFNQISKTTHHQIFISDQRNSFENLASMCKCYLFH